MELAHAERCIPLTEHQAHVGVVVQKSGQLVERTRRDEHGLSLAESCGAGKVTNRQTIGIGGDHTQTASLGRQQDAGQDRTGLIGRCGPDDLLETLGQVR